MKRIRTLAALVLCLAILSGTARAADCDHVFVQKEESATCTDPGVRYEECTLCGYQRGHTNTDPLGHSFGQWKTVGEPDCDTPGQERRECSRCGYDEIRETEATGHRYSSSVVEPDCENQGYTRHTCSVCGDSYKTDYTDALGHRYQNSTVEPTCTKEGYTQSVCSRCGDTVKKDYVDATGHSFQRETVEPTCTKDGYTLNTCTVCGDTEKTDYVNAPGHSFRTEVVPPTCTKEGYTLHTCRVCGDTEKTDPTGKTGHHYDDGVVTKEPTTTAMGRITYTCQGCGDTYTETIPKLVNPFVDVKKSAWYFNAVIWAVDQGITSGTDETHFSPNAPCTRAQVVTFLWRAMGSPEPECAECPFTDVPRGSYYRKAVLWAAEKGITSGVSEDRFGADQICTRAQVVTFLYRAKESPAWEPEDRFSDVKRSDYFFYPVCWAADNGITSGVDGERFGPHQTCTRAQIVTFLFKADRIG